MPFFIGMAVFYVVNIGINWWYYLRPGAERPC
jgi:NNP family nitrate/nitrite transporter-like MFS transporter